MSANAEIKQSEVRKGFIELTIHSFGAFIGHSVLPSILLPIGAAIFMAIGIVYSPLKHSETHVESSSDSTRAVIEENQKLEKKMDDLIATLKAGMANKTIAANSQMVPNRSEAMPIPSSDSTIMNTSEQLYSCNHIVDLTSTPSSSWTFKDKPSGVVVKIISLAHTGVALAVITVNENPPLESHIKLNDEFSFASNSHNYILSLQQLDRETHRLTWNIHETTPL